MTPGTDHHTLATSAHSLWDMTSLSSEAGRPLPKHGVAAHHHPTDALTTVISGELSRGLRDAVSRVKATHFASADTASLRPA